MKDLGTAPSYHVNTGFAVTMYVTIESNPMPACRHVAHKYNKQSEAWRDRKKNHAHKYNKQGQRGVVASFVMRSLTYEMRSTGTSALAPAAWMPTPLKLEE
jgi:hypothetical protein